ncbi:hypothetical protein [Rhizobium sp. NFR12]|uniref:hypothetical protein n=1 Tax=Rhizobium sp. NFR12 TaxID=1566261 RepID=UPI001FCD80BE|nr:hypothetical protein [Rhizobium sp. NFR12]
MGDHPLRNTLENVDGVEGRRDAVKDAVFKFMARNRLAVTASLTAKVVDRQAVFAVGTAITTLSVHRVGSAAFQHPA